MKNFLFLFSVLISFNSFSQSGIYIVTEKYNGVITNNPSFDSLFVTNPQGIITNYSIPNLFLNPGQHDSQLNIILNGIISQGYNVLDGDWNYPQAVNNNLVPGSPYNIRSIFLLKPWTTAGLVPARVNDSQIKITSIFPNPTADIVNLTFASSLNNSKLYLIHSKGYIVDEFNVSNLSEFSINVSSISNGIYFFVLISDGIYSESKTFKK